MRYIGTIIYRHRKFDMAISLFFQKFLTYPVRTGAIAPSSKFLATKIASVVNAMEDIEIIELGAGTGSITSQIKHLNKVTAIEVDNCLAKKLQNKYSDITVVCDDAVHYLQEVKRPCGIVSSLPLILNPTLKQQLTKQLNRLYSEGFLKWAIMYTYALDHPVNDLLFEKTTNHGVVFLNIPPATVWSYS